MRFFITLLAAFSTLALHAQLTVSFTHSISGTIWNTYPKVVFNVSSSGGGVLTQWNWNYGGSTVYSAQWGNTAEVAYANPGTYFVCLNVTDTLSNQASYCDSVAVYCQAKFTSVISSPSVQFNNNSYNSGSDYSWDFGDGSSVNTSKSPSHTYALGGTFNVCLTVTDSLTNCVSTICDSISILATNPCSASFSYNQVGHKEINFANTSMNSSTAAYVMDFGDGWSQRIYGNVNHQYVVQGKYNACLTVLDSANWCTSTYCDSVNVPWQWHIWDIQGKIYYTDSIDHDPLRIYLIKEDTNYSTPYLVAIDSVDTYNYFNFLQKDTGIYYLKAAILPGGSNYYKYFPTYFDNDLFWSNAKPIHLNYKNRYETFWLTQGTNPGGPGFVGGFVSMGANLLPGDPIPGVTVLLLDDSGSPVQHTVSDKDGNYSFANLAYGTYKIYSDILNIPSNAITVVLGPTNPSKENIEIEVNTTGSGAPLGADYNLNTDLNEFSLFPNPTNGRLVLISPESNGLIEVYDNSGKLMHKEEVNESIRTEIDLPLNLKDGTYFVNFTSGEKSFHQLIILNR